MIKLIFIIIIILMIIGGKDIFDFGATDIYWSIQINKDALYNSIYNGGEIVYNFIKELINSFSNNNMQRHT